MTSNSTESDLVSVETLFNDDNNKNNEDDDALQRDSTLYSSSNADLFGISNLLDQLANNDLKTDFQSAFSSINNELKKVQLENESAKNETLFANKRMYEMEVEIQNLSSIITLLTDQKNENECVSYPYSNNQQVSYLFWAYILLLLLLFNFDLFKKNLL